MTEYATIKVAKYRDADGLPTCASNFDTGEVCRFYAAQKFGQHETCFVAGDKSSKFWEGLNRRGNWLGSLIPMKDCPVWPATEEPDPPPSNESQK